MKKIICIFCLTVIFLAGCSGKSAHRQRLGRNLKSQTFLIDTHPYVSLDNFCDAYAFKWEWDNKTRTVFLASPRSTLALCCNSNIVLINGNMECLTAPVLMKKGNVAIPLELTEKIDDKYVWPAKSEKSFQLKTIVIDAGHGGYDPGAVGKRGLQEKDVVLDIGRELKKLLEKEGIKVIMTRERDVFITLWRRSYIANNSSADFFISIHANASRSKKSEGFEVYCLSETIDDEARAVEAVENASLDFEASSIDSHNSCLDIMLWDLYFSEARAQSLQLAEILCDKAASELNVKNRGVKTARFYVLKGARIPAVLVEVGFVSNINEERNLKNAKYREKIARALASGILQYKNNFESTNGFTE